MFTDVFSIQKSKSEGLGKISNGPAVPLFL
jgi:hypothetical protein